jgi:hypothetical protein
VGVQDPLKLAHHLELLGGTAALVDVISSKQSDINSCTQQCNNLTEESEQYVTLPSS